VHTMLTAKMHLHPRKHACATVQQLLCFAMQTIATHLANWSLPKKPSVSTPPYGAVAAALSHRHHKIICHGAGPIQFVCGSNSKLGHRACPSLAQKSISTIVFTVFFHY